MTYIYKEVEVDLSDFADDDLLEELEARNLLDNYSKMEETLNAIWLCRKLSVPYEHLVDQLIYDSLGKII